VEQKVAEIEARLDDRTAGAVATVAPVAAKESPITVSLVDKMFQEADPAAGQGSDRIILGFEVKSSLEQPVRAFTGTVIFNDLFDREVLRGQLTDEDGLKPGRPVTRQAWIQYQQFDEKHRRLRSIEAKDLTSTFVLERVIYKDGSRAAFSETPGGLESVVLRKLSAEVPASAAVTATLVAPASQAAAAAVAEPAEENEPVGAPLPGGKTEMAPAVAPATLEESPVQAEPADDSAPAE
jgi:hypothetical protein